MSKPVLAPSTRRSFTIALVSSAALLILGWFVPDVVAEQSLFAWHRLAVADTFEIAAVLAPPACGALLLLAVLLPIALRPRAVIARVVGPVAIVLPLLGSAPAVPIPGWIVAVAGVAGAAVSALLLSRSRALPAHVVLGALPVAMIAIWLAGVLQGVPVTLLTGVKTPLTIYAGMLATAVSAGVLLGPSLEKER